MSWALVQSRSANGTSNVPTTLTFTSNVAAGNLVVIGVSVFGTDAGNVVTDNLSNVYTKAGASAAISFQRTSIWYGRVLTGGACTITLTFDSGVGNWGWAIHEYSGLDGASPLADYTTGTGVGTAVDAGSAAVANAGSLAFGVWGQRTNIINSTPGAGFTARETQTNGLSKDSVYTEDRSVSATLNIAFTAASPCTWAAAGSVFAPSPPSPQSVAHTVAWSGTFSAMPGIASGVTWSHEFTLKDSYDRLAETVFWSGRFAADVGELANLRYRR